MSERALRGSRLGAVSYETDTGQEPAGRQPVVYDCPQGHTFTVPFSLEAVEIPAEWECRQCGQLAVRHDGQRPEGKAGKPQRTHWDMLLERRTIPQKSDRSHVVL